MNYETRLLEAIKNKLVEVAEREGKSLQFGYGQGEIREHYYLKHLEDNLVVPMSNDVQCMYRKGSGKELGSKMHAIRSSSAMTFNLLGNESVKIESGRHAGKYKIKYEYQLETLENNPHPANLDAYLEGGNEDIYCEMKMLEWLDDDCHEISTAYTNKSRYLVPEAAAENFVALFEELAPNFAPAKEERIAEGRYDCLQMAKHLLAIYNKVATKPDYKPKRVTLLNCVWEFTHPEVLEGYKGKYSKMLEEEHKGFEKFKGLTTKLLVPLFETKGVPLSIEYITASELMESIAYEEPIRRKLERYIV